MKDDKISATDLESEIFEKEEIRVVIRCPKNEQFSDYNYERKSAATTSINDWYNKRLKPILGEYDADIIDGYGTHPHGRTGIENVRTSYTQKN